MSLINSPNTVLANSLDNAIDLIRPRLEINKPKEVVFCVGAQINGLPHIGTYIVQAGSFLIAKVINEKFGIKTSVSFGALDNAPYDFKDSDDGYRFQKTYFHAMQPEKLSELIQEYYRKYFDRLNTITGIPFTVEGYNETQCLPSFRKCFLHTLQHKDEIQWCVAPSSGKLRIRFPHPENLYAEKYAKRTEIVKIDDNEATFRCVALDQSKYDVTVTATGDDGHYLDLNTIYRNIIKEAMCTEISDKLFVMVKGGDWCFSTQPVDWALGVMGFSAIQVPMRIFTPQVVTPTGAKLSK